MHLNFSRAPLLLSPWFVLFLLVVLSATVTAIDAQATTTTHSSQGEDGTASTTTTTTTRPYLRSSRASPFRNSHINHNNNPVHRTLNDMDNETCSLPCCDQNFACNSSDDDDDDAEEGDNPFTQTPVAVQYILIVILLGFSAFFSGLTLGLMSLDKTGLEIVMHGDNAKDAEYARRIYPVRERGNWLLCTLLLGNVCVNSLLSILTADKFGGVVGLVSSTMLIVIFGEILPQAACQRYSLFVGSASVPLVKVVMAVLSPVAWPLSLALDWALGEELATTFSNAELRKLLQIHVQEKIIDHDTATAMQGALQYTKTTAKQVMTPIDKTFMLNYDETLGFETIAKIFKTGYSRIPVYKINKNNVVGLLLVKDLIFIDPEDNTRVSDFVGIFGRSVLDVKPDDNLGDVLRQLKGGKSHMALVREIVVDPLEALAEAAIPDNGDDDDDDDDGIVEKVLPPTTTTTTTNGDTVTALEECEAEPIMYVVKGIITLEDIIEEIIGGEIIDETDAFINNTQETSVDRKNEGFQWETLRLLDSKIVDEWLSYDEIKAATAHLSTNYSSIFSLISDAQLYRLVMETPVTLLQTAQQEVDEDVPHDCLYHPNVETDVCTLILTGKVAVIAGEDHFRSCVSSWGLLAINAIVDSPYKPDFTAWVSAGPCRCLRFSLLQFAAAVDATRLERQPGLMSHATVTLPVNDHGHDAASSQLPMPLQQEFQPSTRNEKFMTALAAVGGIDTPGYRRAAAIVGTNITASSSLPSSPLVTFVEETAKEEQDSPPPQDEKMPSI